MSEEFIENLFHFPGTSNPENVEQVITKAFVNLNELEKAGYKFRGANGKYTRKKKWQNNPKLSVTSSVGKVLINLKKTTTPTSSKFLIGVLYCSAWLENKIKSADVFYNDQHGENRGIASKHGPEKSEYMQSLIAKMNDEEFMLGLNQLIENPLPETLTEIQRSIIEATRVGVVSEDEVRNLMDTHNCLATDISRQHERLKAMMGGDNRVPNTINYPNITLLEHEEIMDTQTMRQQIQELKEEIIALESALQTSKKNVSNKQTTIDNLKSRGLLSRIFNRNV
ncbi:MAG: hypothetical protein VXY42_00965 [Candidatus Thermoplasmatota archaeon]|nr:hypothetical protein [Candidatus Thermoplasmatota archaeon]